MSAAVRSHISDQYRSSAWGNHPTLCLYSETESKEQPLYSQAGAVSHHRVTQQEVARHLSQSHTHTHAHTRKHTQTDFTANAHVGLFPDCAVVRVTRNRLPFYPTKHNNNHFIWCGWFGLFKHHFKGLVRSNLQNEKGPYFFLTAAEVCLWNICHIRDKENFARGTQNHISSLNWLILTTNTDVQFHAFIHGSL